MRVRSLHSSAGCAHCFGPRWGWEPVGKGYLERAVERQASLDDDEPLEVTFGKCPEAPGHPGGKPSCRGLCIYPDCRAMTCLSKALGMKD